MRVAWIIVLAAGLICGQELPRATAEYGAFGLPDESGTRLIAMAGMPDAAPRTSLCSDGSVVPVRFEGRQTEKTNESGRQTPAQFDRLGGDVFRILKGKVSDAETCFLPGNGWVSGAEVVPVKADIAACGEESRIAASRGRAVVRCFSLGRLEGEGRIVLAEFARQGTEALASVVLMNGNRMLFGDYPAKFRGDGEDLWRVDDGGVLSAEGFRVVFVMQRGERYLMGVSWAGTEGRSLAVFESGRGNTFQRVIEDYWYQAPE